MRFSKFIFLALLMFSFGAQASGTPVAQKRAGATLCMYPNNIEKFALTVTPYSDSPSAFVEVPLSQSELQISTDKKTMQLRLADGSIIDLGVIYGIPGGGASCVDNWFDVDSKITLTASMSSKFIGFCKGPGTVMPTFGSCHIETYEVRVKTADQAQSTLIGTCQRKIYPHGQADMATCAL
jgi:hypothetical protein